MILKYLIRCTTEGCDKYWYLPSSSPTPTKCPDDTAHSVNLSSVAIIQSSAAPEPNPKTTDNRDLVAVNRIPSGYTVYPTGAGDDISTGQYGAGPDLKMDKDNKTCTLQMKDHFYAIGGRAIWEGASLVDSVSAKLVAPATVGTNSAGNFNKVALGGGMNVYVPAAPGAGAWSLDLTAKLNSHVNILSCTPVPVVGNTGFFDYDSDKNLLTVNTAQKGGYNLYDFDAPLFKFCNKLWGRKWDGAESVQEASDVVGKLLYNSWKLVFTLATADDSTCKVGLVINLGVKGNTP